MPSPEKVATPLVVVALVRPDSDAPPEIETVITVPFTGRLLPPASRTRTAGCCASVPPLATVAEGWVSIASCAAAPGLSVIEPETTLGRPVEANVSV